MDKPSTSDHFSWETRINATSLDLSLANKPPGTDEEIEDEDIEDIEEVEVDENERLHLQKVSSLVEAAYQRVEQFGKQQLQHTFHISSAAGSENSSCPSSTLHQVGSVPDSIDGGKAEVEELKNIPVSFESALRINQVLQRRLTATLNRLEKTLENNILRQEQLKDEEEEQGLLNSQEKEYRESRNKYFARPSSFAIPYFKDRSGMPAPMNKDAKFKVDRSYIDLYSTRLRTWLTAEQNLLVKKVQEEWKNHLISDWQKSLKNAERKLKGATLTEEEEKEVMNEIESCQNHVNFFSNVKADKIDMPPGADLDWDKVSAQAFDGCRTTEECQLLWENYLHPSINKSPFTEEEDIDIQDAVLQSVGKPKWDEIADQVDTGRAPYQVMQRWVSYIKPTIQPARWTMEASKKLEDTINMLRVGSHIPWAQVARHLTGYTKVQLQSRWRVINPEQSKGPFTVDEDFLLIKGLYKLGMNFELIAHFLPGRNKVQVRERFKRSVLPGLTARPWTWKEDRKIIKNCTMDVQHWRRMAALLPGRDTCQIRLRFFILHFWQNCVRTEDKLPPPLFPLSLTEKASEIKSLRKKIRNLSPDVQIFLDSIEANKHVDKSVTPFEHRRAALAKKQDSAALEKFLQEKPGDPVKPPLIRKKKKGRYGPREPSWPDKALIEFFLPGRTVNAPSVDLEDLSTREHLHRLGQALQLRINKSVNMESVSELQEEFVDIESTEAEVIEDIFVQHHLQGDYSIECLACFTQQPDIIPMMPPNEATVGGFRSLLLHKPKLEEMASKEFLLFQVPRSQIHKLGKKPKTMNEIPIDELVNIDEEELRKAITSKDDNQADEDVPEEPETQVSSRGRKRKAAAVATLVNHVYSQTVKKPKIEVRQEVLEPPSEQELLMMQKEGEKSAFRKSALNMSKQQLMKREDKLLFHRMLSLFFWPALFTQRKPPKGTIHLSSEIAKDARLSTLNLPDCLYDPEANEMSHLKIDEQEKIVQTLEAVRNRKQREQKKLFGKLDGTIQPEDYAKRVFKKSIVKLKRSLVMKKAWTGRHKRVPSKEVKRSEELAPSRKSQRLESIKKTRIQKMREEERKWQEEEEKKWQEDEKRMEAGEELEINEH